MGDTADQVKHEVAGMANKAAGAVTGSDDLKEKGDEHLEDAHEIEEEHDAGKLGISKGSDGTTHSSWKS